MKKLFLFASLLTSGIYFAGCKSDIEYKGENDFNEIDTTIVNEKAKDTVGIELLVLDKYLITTKKEARFMYYAAEEGMMAINSLLLPEADNPALPAANEASNASFPNASFVAAARLTELSDKNVLFGYPSGCAINDTATLVIGEKRVNEKESGVNDFSGDFIISQKVGPEKFGAHLFENVFRYAPYGERLLYDTNPCVGSNGKDTIVAKVQTGLIVGSFDKDRDTITWKHFPLAFAKMNELNTQGGTNGRFYQLLPPTICHSSKFGFLMFLGSQIDQATTKPGYIMHINPVTGEVSEVKLNKPVLVEKTVGSSKVYIENWAPKFTRDNVNYEHIPLLSSISAQSIESDIYGEELPKGSIILFGLSKEKVYQTYYKYKEGDKLEDLVFETAYQMNIEGTQTKHSPISFIINPYNQRIEIVHATPYLMDLWSLDLAAFMSSDIEFSRKVWKRECVLLDRDISIRGYGLYPCATVCNVNRSVSSGYMTSVEKRPVKENDLLPGVQKIIFASGNEYPARIAMFEMTRSLDTEKFAKWVSQKRYYIQNQSY